MTAKLAIVGRPNVGKSTLFNRLVGRKVAIVADQPGVTRDRREGVARLGGLDATVIDTAGWEEGVDKRSIEARMRAQTEIAAAEADAVLFLVDARAGVTPMDAAFGRWLRKHAKKTILLANKCEGRAGLSGLAEAYKLGFGDPVAISGEHGEGIGDLFDRLRDIVGDIELPPPEADDEDEEPLAAPARAAIHDDGDDEPESDGGFDVAAATRAAEAELAASEAGAEAAESARIAERPMQLAIVGRPNVGKSTLMNRILGEERTLTGPEAGITRDAVYVDWPWKGQVIRLVDTAGMRRKASISAAIERASVGNTLEAIRFADVVALVVDAEQMLEKQDLSIARMIIEEGRALVIVVNKVDILAKGGEKMRLEAWQKLRDRIEASFSQAKGVALVGLSARTGRGVDKLIPAALAAREVWNKRIPTGDFNRWLGEALERNPTPLAKTGRRIRIRYGAQIKARPPTFALFVSRPVDLPDSYLRYLENRLRQDFDFPGTPIRLVVRKPRNPYAKR